MKNHYQVKVRETYSKFVDVYVEDESQIEEEVSAMEENGEIEWDRGEDFDEWEIISTEEVQYADWEIRNVKRWCRNTVAITALSDPDWVKEEMDEYECQQWYQLLVEQYVDMPAEVTSCDLWDAVEAHRKGDMSYGK